jgi:hypothetical protein
MYITSQSIFSASKLRISTWLLFASWVKCASAQAQALVRQTLQMSREVKLTSKFPLRAFSSHTLRVQRMFLWSDHVLSLQVTVMSEKSPDFRSLQSVNSSRSRA